MLIIQKSYTSYTLICHYYPKKMKIDKSEKLVHDIIHIKALQQILYQRLILQRVHSVTKFNQEVWLKPYLSMSREIRTEAKNDFQKDIFVLTNNSLFRKNMEHVRKHRDIKLVKNVKKRN